MAHLLASLWETTQTNFLADSDDSVTVHYKPERTGNSAFFDDFFQEGTDAASPTEIGTGTAANILSFDGNDYMVLPSPTALPIEFTIEFYCSSSITDAVIMYFGDSTGLGGGNYISLQTWSYDNSIRIIANYPGNIIIYGAEPDTWYKATLSITTTTVELSVEGLGSDSIDMNGSFASWDTFYMGAGSDLGSPARFFTGLIRKPLGDYSFGLAYQLYSFTALADINDTVDTVVNVGSIGGLITQSSASNRPILYTGSVNEITLGETTATSVSVSGKTHLDLYGASIGAGEGEQKLSIGKFPEADALFTCLLSGVKTSTDPDPILTVFDNDDDAVDYIIVDKDNKKYSIEAVKMRGMGATPFLVDVFLKFSNREV